MNFDNGYYRSLTKQVHGPLESVHLGFEVNRSAFKEA